MERKLTMTRTKSLTVTILLIFALAASGLQSTLLAQSQSGTQPRSVSLPVVGSGAGTFTGTFELQRFVTRNGQVMAQGLLTGTVSTAAGVIGTVARTVSLPVTIGESTCEILHLDLGPLNLDLLGLQIDLSRIVLDITAESGAGNLLGNLLCAVANLLNDPSGLTRLLNSILDLLR
jgi:hypothetical protein